MKNRYVASITVLIGVIFIFVFSYASANFIATKSTIAPKLRTMDFFDGKFNSQTAQLINNSRFDVIVIGSDPEAITSAIAAARAGEKTLLIDKNPIVGGLFTLGKLNMLDLSVAPANELLTKGLFLEFYKNINKRTSFDVKQAQVVFEDMLANEKNLTVQLKAKNIKPLIDDNNRQHKPRYKHIDGLTFLDSFDNTKTIYGKKFIDATPDADFAYLAGATFSIGQEDYRNEQKMMAVSLVFELAGVDFPKVQAHLNSDDDPYTGADQYSAWGYGKQMANYHPLEDHVRIRALNIGKQNNGHVLINAFQILGVNGLNPEELTVARRKATAELPRVTKFLRENLEGFENAKLVGTADHFYIRETRHLDAEYQLTVNDILENRDFEDRIAFGNYPVDVQATVLEDGDVVVGNPTQYAIPFRSIVPKGFTNLLVASRSAGYDSLAHGSTRTVPIGMVVGQAAGVAAAYTNQEDINFLMVVQDKSLTHIRNIQRILNKNGADLKKIPQYDHPIVTHWAYEGVKFLRRFALIEAGYENNYRLDEPLTQDEFRELCELVASYSRVPYKIAYPPVQEKNKPMTQNDIINFLKANRLSETDLTAATKNYLMEQNGIISRDILYMVIYDFFKAKNKLS